MAKRELGIDLDAALRAWGKLERDREARRLAVSVVESMMMRDGARIERLYEGADGRYLAVVLANGSRNVDAFINVGFIHHRAPLDGSVFDAAIGMWRRQLPTGGAPTTRSGSGKQIATVMCPTHFEPHPVTAQCPLCADE